MKKNFKKWISGNKKKWMQKMRKDYTNKWIKCLVMKPFSVWLHLWLDDAETKSIAEYGCSTCTGWFRTRWRTVGHCSGCLRRINLFATAKKLLHNSRVCFTFSLRIFVVVIMFCFLWLAEWIIPNNLSFYGFICEFRCEFTTSVIPGIRLWPQRNIREVR